VADHQRRLGSVPRTATSSRDDLDERCLRRDSLGSSEVLLGSAGVMGMSATGSDTATTTLDGPHGPKGEPRISAMAWPGRCSRGSA